MRNQFRKPKNVNCAILFSSNKLSLQVIYVNAVNIYYLQRCMNWLNIINTAPPPTMYERRWDMSLILNTNKIQEKICAEITYIQDCRLDFFQILNGV